LLELINNFIQNSDVHLTGTQILFMLAENENCLKQIAQKGGIETVITLTKQQTWHLYLIAACDFFAIIAREVEYRRILVHNGGIKLIINAMKQYTNLASLQESGASALANIALDSENKRRISQLGGIEVLLAAMKTHINFVDTLENCMICLSNIATNNLLNKKQIAQGGLELIVSAMVQHPKEVKLQTHICNLLYRLSKHCDENKAAIIELGCLDTIKFVKEKYSYNASLQTSAAKVIDSLNKVCSYFS